MKNPEEIACALVDDFWAKGPECTQEYAREKIAAALREAILTERREIMALLGYDENGEDNTREKRLWDGVEVEISSEPYYDLEGALIDMRRTGKADDVCLRTIERAQKRFADVSRRAWELAGNG